MPELPEVETVRRGLERWVIGKKLKNIQALHPRVERPDSWAPITSLEGAKVTGINRRGKFLWFELDRPQVLMAHLGMSGQFLIQEKDRPPAKHVRAQFELKKSLRTRDLVFNDQRTFGWLSVEELTDGVPSSASHIAYDPFDPHFDYQATIAKMAKRNIRIKTALLNQEIMSGVGNIYADEALWRAKVHPESMTSELSRKKIATVIDSATEVMREAIAKGGTSFDDLYINVNGESGFFEQSLSAYGREDEPCPRCGTLIKRIVFGARSSHFCPRCQRKKI
jgi:formamidopyrimidine-DNA glycosylase